MNKQTKSLNDRQTKEVLTASNIGERKRSLSGRHANRQVNKWTDKYTKKVERATNREPLAEDRQTTKVELTIVKTMDC